MSQKLIITGHLGNDPEMRYVPSGTPVTSFSLATNRNYTKDGKKVKETTWFRIQTWGKQAEACRDYLTKGSLVYIEGVLQSDESNNGGPRIWTDKEGKPRAGYEVNASVVEFLSTTGTKNETPFDRHEEDF